MSGYSEEWIDIQRKTFTNWVNDQLSVTGKQIDNLEIDLCNGEILVALVEALQFKKIGKVFRNPKNRLQMFENVALAFRAIAEDNVRLVNIGNEDVVNGNGKLILGLIWHLIIRYQISSSKTKAPPKKTILQWLCSALPDLNVANLTSDWNDGIALHALLEHCKPGLSPNWRELHSKDRVENCRRAMALAKEHLNIPKVVSPEDFANPNLDELSAMTYLSYFVKPGSPGYYSTLNWVCKQIRSTTVTNLTTDWNDGYYLCCIAQSLGAEIPGWPDIDRNDHIGNCQKGIEAGKSLGIQPILTASEMADPSVDHLTMMAYINSYRNIKPILKKEDKFQVRCGRLEYKFGEKPVFYLDALDDEYDKDKIQVDVTGPGKYETDITWSSKQADVTLTPLAVGMYRIRSFYDDVEIKGGPVLFNVSPDISKVKVTSHLGKNVILGTEQELTIDMHGVGQGNIEVEAKSPTGTILNLPIEGKNGFRKVAFNPTESGTWTISTLFENERVDGGTFSISVLDPQSIHVEGPTSGVSGEVIVFKAINSPGGEGEITAYVKRGLETVPCSLEFEDEGNTLVKFTPNHGGPHKVHVLLNSVEVKGSPKTIEVQDPGEIYVIGDGCEKCQVGEKASFTVHPDGHDGDIDVQIRESGERIEFEKTFHSDGTTEVVYKPDRVGMYTVDVKWNGLYVSGSPFLVRVTDPSKITCMEELADWMDEDGRFLLDYEQETALRYRVAGAGPGKFTGEVIGPSGRIPVNVSNIRSDVVQVAFSAMEKGDHYIHLYWSDISVDNSPLLGYCLGPKSPLDYTKVTVLGTGSEMARVATLAQFIIDGRYAGPGIPEVRMEGIKSTIDVVTKPLSCDRHKCTYTPDTPGSYLLYIYWSGDQIPNSPYKVTVTVKGEAGKVVVCGEGLKGGFAGKELRVLVDTNPTGPGEISATCMGPTHTARCDLFDHHNRTYTVRIFPHEPGRHTLNIMYDTQHVQGSPFTLRVVDPPNPARVKVNGPGVEDGVIQKYQSRFIVETRGAGAGQLAVKIRGPKAAFKVEMLRESNIDRTILCRYDPSEPGNYVINVRWSGDHVPGSPFNVNIFGSLEEQQKFKQEKGVTQNGTDSGSWQEEI